MTAENTHRWVMSTDVGEGSGGCVRIPDVTGGTAEAVAAHSNEKELIEITGGCHHVVRSDAWRKPKVPAFLLNQALEDIHDTTQIKKKSELAARVAVCVSARLPVVRREGGKGVKGVAMCSSLGAQPREQVT